jgi:hypothetical protein
LQGFSANPLQVVAGDAVRLSFQWRAGYDLDERYVIGLTLVDETGTVWAQRYSEPCGGWCSTDTWMSGSLQQDQHALLIPPGTPPGFYRLQVAWAPLDGGPALLADDGGQKVEQVELADVAVECTELESSAIWILPNPLSATFGEQVTLLGYQSSDSEVRIGQSIKLETHWRAEGAPRASYDLLVELTDHRGEVVASWQQTPSAVQHPTDVWQAGQYVRGQHELPIPSHVPAGQYEMRLALISANGDRLDVRGEVRRQILGGLLSWRDQLAGQDLELAPVRVVDRPRHYELPSAMRTLGGTIGRRAHLVGYELDDSQAHAGGQVRLTLYWQASGPMVKAFKVFTHVIDAENRILGQHDGPPGGGCCPTNTWAEEEVIADEHVLPLRTDVPPGEYQLVVGMYDEETSSRLAAYSANGDRLVHDRIPVGRVVVEKVSLEGQQTDPRAQPQFHLDYVVFLPLVNGGTR